MTQLFINKLPAVLAAGVSFKLTRENPALTDSGDHTLEVTLPLRDCPQNRKIFGLAHRTDISHIDLATARLPFLLAADELLIRGDAIVLNINEEDIKVQLIGGRSYLNLQSRESDALDRYIDELDLGRAWDTAFDTYPSSTLRLMLALTFPQDRYSYRDREGVVHMGINQFQRNLLRWGTSDDTDCVMFPIFSKADGLCANAFTFNDFGRPYQYSSDWTPSDIYEWRTDEPNSYPGFPLLGTIEGDHFELHYRGTGTAWNIHAANVLAPQPYLCFIVERIIKAIGFSIDTNALRSGSMKDVFIANARGTLFYNQMLPHWTVREFLTEVQRLCGVWFNVRENVVSIQSVSDLADATPQNVNAVVASRTIEVSSGVQQQSTSTASVVYDLQEPKAAIFLPEEVWERADIVEVDSYFDIPRPTVGEADFAKLFVITSPNAGDYGHYFIYYAPPGSASTRTADIIQVNHLGALRRTIQHNNEADITLRIVPVDIVKKIVRWHTFMKKYPADATDYILMQHFSSESTPEDDFFDVNGNDAVTVCVLQTASSRAVSGYDPINIQDILSTDTDTDDTAATESSPPSVIEVAVNRTEVQPGSPARLSGITAIASPADPSLRPTTAPSHSFQMPWSFGIPYLAADTDAADRLLDRPGDLTFVLTDLTSPVRKNLDAAVAADARVKHQIDFTDRTAFDPSLPFIIGGRRFVCERLEYNIDDHGIQPLRRGYFYEVDE